MIVPSTRQTDTAYTERPYGSNRKRRPSPPRRPGAGVAGLAHGPPRLSVMVDALVLEEGPHGVLRRLAHPFWFQALGCVMGMDWHSNQDRRHSIPIRTEA